LFSDVILQKGGPTVKTEKAKAEYLQIRVSEGQKEFAKGLADDYGIDVSKLVLFALDYINKQRPPFVIESQGKFAAPSVEIPSRTMSIALS